MGCRKAILCLFYFPLSTFQLITTPLYGSDLSAVRSLASTWGMFLHLGWDGDHSSSRGLYPLPRPPHVIIILPAMLAGKDCGSTAKPLPRQLYLFSLCRFRINFSKSTSPTWLDCWSSSLSFVTMYYFTGVLHEKIRQEY